MGDDKLEVPQPVSIQTGNGGVKRLIPLREDKYEIPEHHMMTQNMPQEPDHLQQTPIAIDPVSNECFIPPPLPQEKQEEPNIQNVSFQPQPQPQSQGVKFDPQSNMSSMTPISGYNIIDLFWFINPKLTGKKEGREQISDQEAHFCAISFNINFGNLKVTFHKIPNGAIQGNVLFLQSLMRLTSGTIYPSSLFKMTDLYKYKTEDTPEEELEFTCLEQLLRNTNEAWQTVRPVCKFKMNNHIKLSINDPKSGDFFYEFNGWQLRGLLHAANFALTEGVALHGQHNIQVSLKRG